MQKTEEQSFKLTIQNPITTFLAHYHWAIADQTVYLLTEEQEAIYTTLLQLMKRLEEPSIIYEKETVSDLFSEVLPLLEKIGRVSVEESVEELVVHHPLKAVFIFKTLGLTITMEKSFSRQTRNMLNYLKLIKKSFEIKQKKQQLNSNFNSFPISKQPQALKKSYLLESPCIISLKPRFQLSVN